jgi:hypothetical protein
MGLLMWEGMMHLNGREVVVDVAIEQAIAEMDELVTLTEAIISVPSSP